MDRQGHARPEEVLRLLASAANAFRLYPPTSDLPTQAVERFLRFAASTTTATGPLRFTVNPHGFRLGETDIGPGLTQVVALAETLHAMQAGQLIIAPEIDEAETRTFLQIVTSEALAVRQGGGIRTALGNAGVSHIAVIEVTLRASEEEGLAGLDLTSAPLDDIAAEVTTAAEDWARSAAAGQGADAVSTALDRLEAATRDLASERVAQAMLRLDEDTRERILAAALVPDVTSGKRMEGMLEIIARMNPSTIARLLKLTAERLGATPDPLLAAIDLPPEVLAQVMMILNPSPRSEQECGVPQSVNVDAMAAEASAEEEEPDLERQVALSAPQLASGRALTTTVQVSRLHAGLEAVRAIAEALPSAARDGALVECREALRRLDELREDPALTADADRARATLADEELLRDVCRAPLTDADAAVAGEILAAAGPTGAAALLECYVSTDEFRRSLLRPTLRGMSDQVLNVAGRLIRNAGTPIAIAVLKTLPALGDRRAMPVIVSGLEHLDSEVRRAALTALADTMSDDGTTALAKALGHWDPGTRRFAARELGRTHSETAVPALVRVLDEIELFERNYELKKEVITSLEAIGSARAVPVLKRIVGNRFSFGRKNKELRFLAEKAMERIVRESGPTGGR
ncbi:MAG: hypothetical protein C0418_00420 [Coriobacteriaceae bacterium]|nr:hypothetical protein [Coriobacteriaceae bacterium]